MGGNPRSARDSPTDSDDGTVGRARAPNQGGGSAFLLNAPLAALVFTPDGTVVEANPAFAALLARRPAQLRGRHLREVTGEAWPVISAATRRVMLTGETVTNVEIGTSPPDAPGALRHWLVNVFPMGDDDAPATLGLVAVDITAKERSRRESRVLARASDLSTMRLDREDALQRASRVAIPEFADACLVHFRDRDGSRRALLAHRDPSMEARIDALGGLDPAYVQGDELHPDEPRMPSVMPDVTEADRRRTAADADHLAALALLDARSAVTAPLVGGGREHGAVTLLYTSASGRRYDEADVELVHELARRVGQLLDGIRLTGEAEQARARLDLLARVGELLTVELDLHERLRDVALMMLPDLGDAAGVYLREQDELQLVAVAHADPEVDASLAVGSLPRHPLDAELPPCEALRRVAPVLAVDVPGHVAAALAGTETGPGGVALRSLLCVPLVAGDAIGVLALVRHLTRRAHVEADVQVAVELARRIAPAVEHARRYERERQIVELLQRSLLPATLPDVPGVSIAGRYVPGTEGLHIGGDWYDAFTLPDGRMFLAIGDVVGHGVRAASSMGRMRVALQVYALEGLSPHEMLERLNHHFAGITEADMATLAVIVLDTVGGDIRVASAGHPPPAVRDADGAVSFLPVVAGPPVCATSRPTYTTTAGSLPDGAALVLYTDGLVERRGEAIDTGLARVAESLGSVHGDVAAIADRLVTDHPNTHDDVAVLVVQIEPYGAPLHMRVDARPRELAVVRHAVNRWLTRAGVCADDRADLVLAANEAVANAIEHAYGPDDAALEFEATLRGGVVELCVTDFGRWRPERDVGGGRGITLIKRVTDEMHVDTTGYGTRVRIRKRLGGSAGGGR